MIVEFAVLPSAPGVPVMCRYGFPPLQAKSGLAGNPVANCAANCYLRWWSPGRRFSFQSVSVAVRLEGVFDPSPPTTGALGTRRRAGVAQLVEHLICNQRVGGSNPFASSRFDRSHALRYRPPMNSRTGG